MAAALKAQKDQPPPHPLEVELADLIACDPRMWGFLQEGSLDGVWYWDLENPSDEWMSPEFWHLLGIDPATKSHDPTEWQDIIFPEDLALAVENFEKHCADPAHPYDQIVRYRHADGSTVWVRCRGIAIRDDRGRAIRMLGAHTDLTACKLAEQAALDAKAQIELSNAELKSFAYGVSHDLKSPARTALQMIEEAITSAPDRLSTEQREFLDDACNILGRMQVLIDDLLGYGQLVEQDMAWNEVDLNCVAHEAHDNIASEIKSRGAQIDITPLGQVNGHRAQLLILMQNLMLNAIKYHRPGLPARVRVSSHLKTDHTGAPSLVIRVDDNGCGIAPEHIDRIFGVFSRLHRQDEVAGSGLGLALCNRVATNHGATIEVTSEVGLGSRFDIHFPERTKP